MNELDRFIDTFNKAIRGEMESMRKQLGSFEVPLGMGQLDETSGNDIEFTYIFPTPSANDKLHPGLECTLRTEKSEYLVQIGKVESNSVNILCNEDIPLVDRTHILVIYPWFLYEKLMSALDSLRGSTDFHIENAMLLFGKRTPQQDKSERAQLEHLGLNPSQLRAIDLCCSSNLSFVWGPPGTGKTSTLAPILAEMLHRGYRTLITSTTNVAVDHALDKLLDLPIAQNALENHRIIRIGQSSGTTRDVGLHTIAALRNKDAIDHLRTQRELRLDRIQQLAATKTLLDKLDDDLNKRQMNLFAEEMPRQNHTQDLKAIFPLCSGRHLKMATADVLQSVVMHRQTRLEYLVSLYDTRIEEAQTQLRHREQKTLENAQLVFSTMSGAYLNTLLSNERFDVVVIEEAGMAVLPTLFYCATLASKKVIAVGDPRQLPPIVQSRESFVHRAMGRNIFDVSAPTPLESDFVALLDTQYRMHPTIGQLVSELYYEGRLRHAALGISQNLDWPPFPQDPLVLLDTKGQSHCQTTQRYSRINDFTAKLSAKLALEAANAGVESIGIITPYNEQAKLIRQVLRESGLNNDKIESSTVHRFQGQERDMIILDTTDAAPLKPGILLNGSKTAANLLNVSLSRARAKLIVIADGDYFHRGSPNSPITRLLQTIERVGTSTTVQG